LQSSSDRLLAQDDEAGIFLFDDGFEDLATATARRVGRSDRCRDGSSPGRRGSFPGLRGAIDMQMISVACSSLQAERLFDGDLSEGFIDILTLASSTPVNIGLDANLHVVVDDPLTNCGDFHECARNG
jgi:hypothetical protein